MAHDIEKDAMDAEKDKDHSGKSKRFVQEAILELVQTPEGKMVLRDSNSNDEPLVTITFSDKVKGMLEGETYAVGQHMIHAAIQAVMHKQISQWHANVYDEEPDHYS